MHPTLYWLPPEPEFRARLQRADRDSDVPELLRLASTRLDFLQTNALDRAVQKSGERRPDLLPSPQLKIAVLSSCTISHLNAAIRVAALRRGFTVSIYEAPYGLYRQELLDPESGLHAFRPEVVLFTLDAYHLRAVAGPGAVDERLQHLRTIFTECWALARNTGAAVIQQTVANVFQPVLGQNEHRLKESDHRLIGALNRSLADWADEMQVDILALEAACARDGLYAWTDPLLWARNKQEISPAAAPMYGELLARLVGARIGRSRKCVVLDLDNTLWGGVIGDDGLAGIALGEGTALGESYSELQRYLLALAQRGILLAVCSKNDHANAVEPFEKHADMILRLGRISSFVANWKDKAANIRSIAAELNIGLDSLVFLDDSPAERDQVRRELPMVATPEISDEPAFTARALADAGYFETASITAEDRARTDDYQSNQRREEALRSASNMDGFLLYLEMNLMVDPIGPHNLPRATQLINKTNQFNLTTRRYTLEQLQEVLARPRVVGLTFKLKDRFGDNGLIAVVLIRPVRDREAEIDSWLMSCRVLGRRVEEAILASVVAAAKAAGYHRLIGRYISTAKNQMVQSHYPKLGFSVLEGGDSENATYFLDLADFSAADLPIRNSAQ